MSTDEYVPSGAKVRHAYVVVESRSDVLAARAEFDRFLARVRRDAWAEGFQDGRRYDGEGDDGPRYINPYSGQDADQ